MSHQIIKDVVEAFYKKATTDFLISYQFRKIQEFESLSPITPPIEAFRNHLPRIVTFWELQLLNQTPTLSNLPKKPFNLIEVHRRLNINKGELHRWILLFEETLNEFKNKDPELIKQWHKNIFF